MALRSYTCGFFLAGILVTVGSFGEWEPLVLAASAEPKKGVKPPVVQPLAPDRQVSITLPKVRAKQSARTESSKTVTAAPQEQTPSERVPKKTRRHR